ncbi:MAG: peptide-N-glycosidase F-related protein, partial [Myxococcales bacterium]
LASTCFPFDSWQANPPPPGHNWPADCDAYDRNFEFVLDPAASASERPGIELVRAITPFGGPMRFEVDVTDLANGLPGKHRLQAYIATWPDPAGRVSGARGGWNVSARLEVKHGEPPRRVLAVVPLFDGVQTTAGSPGPVSFTVPEGVARSRLEYRATGHGGGSADADCIGHADEFCKRVHTLRVDGEVFETVTPWRNDCKDLCTLETHTWPSGGTMQYCRENPCGAIASVRAPRANWCPGSVTPPLARGVPALTIAGAHTFAWDVAKIADGGSWRISAHWIAYGP